MKNLIIDGFFVAPENVDAFYLTDCPRRLFVLYDYIILEKCEQIVAVK